MRWRKKLLETTRPHFQMRKQMTTLDLILARKPDKSYLKERVRLTIKGGQLPWQDASFPGSRSSPSTSALHLLVGILALLCWFIFILPPLQSLSKGPRWQLDKSIIGTNPGVGIPDHRWKTRNWSRRQISWAKWHFFYKQTTKPWLHCRD